MKLKQLLKNKVNKKLLQKIPSSFDILGSKEKAVAIIEIPRGLGKIEKTIARTIIQNHKNVKSVLKKTSGRTGKLRLRKFKLILGNNTEVIHKESGCLLKLDPKKVYFSSRESSERLRLASLVRKKENILVMFSGIAPIPIVIAKLKPVGKIYAVELNKTAHKYALENIKLNKLQNKIIAYQGDVVKILPKINKKFDRIIMPLPKQAHDYLNLATSYLKKKGTLHIYFWSEKENMKEDAKKLIKKYKKFKIKKIKKILSYAPRKWKSVVDIKFL